MDTNHMIAFELVRIHQQELLAEADERRRYGVTKRREHRAPGSLWRQWVRRTREWIRPTRPIPAGGQAPPARPNLAATQAVRPPVATRPKLSDPAGTLVACAPAVVE